MQYLKKDFLTILRRIDLFGVSINIRFKDQEKHQTRFGGLFSICLITAMIFMMVNLLLQIINKEKPIVLMEDVIIQQPHKYKLQEDNFSFAVGVYDQDIFKPFMDPSYYTVQARFTYKAKEMDANGKQEIVFKNRLINMIPCTLDSFKVENTRQYFEKQEYSKLYCLDFSQNLYLEGQFDSDEFSVIEILFKKCEVSCQETTQLETRLKKTFLQIYYTTSVVQPSSFDKPFKSIGQTQFYYTNLLQSQAINMQYMNTYVIDQIGFFETSQEIQRSLIFNQDRLLLQNQDSLYLISIFLEKNKEKYYYRSYLQVKDALSQIGGIFNFLFLVGAVICQPYSRMQLQRKLLNSTFSFPSKDNDLKAIKNNSQPPSPSKKKNSKTPTIQVIPDDTKDECVKKFFQSSFQEAKVKTKEFFLLLIEKFFFKKSENYEMLKLGKEKVYQYTDISFIINKLIEIEKIKHLILEQEQIKLFEFIPKPKLKSIYREAKKISNIYSSSQQRKVLRSMSINNFTSNEVNILSIENKDMKFKADQAQEAFNKIYKNKQKQSKVDKKLITMLDKDLIDLLQMDQTSLANIQFSSNNYKQYMQKDLQKIKNSEDTTINGSPPSRGYLGLNVDNSNISMRQSIDAKSSHSNVHFYEQGKFTFQEQEGETKKNEIIYLDEIYDCNSNNISELKNIEDTRVASPVKITRQMQQKKE